MSDHEKLKWAIARARETAKAALGPDWSGDTKWLSPWKMTACDLTALADAAESTLPKVKMVEVWHVEYAVQPDGQPPYPCIRLALTAADADRLRQDHERTSFHSHVRVTGPHLQEVPA